MNIYQFMGEHPWLTIALALCAVAIVQLFANLLNRVIRHFNIRKHGYPPPHCDADGDFREGDSKSTEACVSARDNSTS